MSENLNVDAPSFTPMAGSPGPWSLADVGASPWRPDSQQQRAAAVAALALGAAAGTRLPMTIAAQRLISQQQPPRARAFSAPADVDDDDGAQTSSSDDGGVSPRIRAQVSPRSSLGKSSNSRRYSQEMRDQGSASGSGGQSGSATGSGTAPQQNQSLYKTELCRSFVETGSCRYGSKCQFAHGKEELRQVSRHPRYKTEICKTFHTIGTCRYGTRCRFIHMKPEEYEQFQQQQAAQAALAAQQSQQLGSSSPSASSSGAGAGLVAPSSPPKSVMGPGVVASAVPPMMMISPKNAASPMMVASAPNSPLMCSSIAGSPGFPSSPALMGQPPLHQALNFQLRQTMTVGSLSLPPPLPVSDFQSFQTRMDPQKTVVEQPPLSSPRSPRSPIYNSAPPPLLSHPGAPQGLTVVPPAPLAPGTPEPASPGMTRRRLAVFREITM